MLLGLRRRSSTSSVWRTDAFKRIAAMAPHACLILLLPRTDGAKLALSLSVSLSNGSDAIEITHTIQRAHCIHDAYVSLIELLWLGAEIQVHVGRVAHLQRTFNLIHSAR